MARPIDLSLAAALDVHLLPAAIEHNGEAMVQAYFQPQETGESHRSFKRNETPPAQ